MTNSEATAIEFLYSLELTRKEYETIPEDQRAALGIVSFATNEISALAKAYIFFDHDLTGNQVIDAAITIQKGTVLRNWSATILDFSKFFTEKSKRNKTDDEVLQALIEEARTMFGGLKASPTYKLVRILRNEVTNHFYLEPARRNLEYVSDSADLSIQMHKMNGNSFAPLGEEVMVMARINEFGKFLFSKEEKLKLHRDWMDWNLAAAQWCRDVHDLFLRKVVVDRFPDKHLRKMDYWVPHQLVASRENVLAPVFFRNSDK